MSTLGELLGRPVSENPQATQAAQRIDFKMQDFMVTTAKKPVKRLRQRRRLETLEISNAAGV